MRRLVVLCWRGLRAAQAGHRESTRAGLPCKAAGLLVAVLQEDVSLGALP